MSCAWLPSKIHIEKQALVHWSLSDFRNSVHVSGVVKSHDSRYSVSGSHLLYSQIKQDNPESGEIIIPASSTRVLTAEIS